MAFTWIFIPIAGLLFVAWQEWLKFKTSQAQIGASTTDIERALEKMTKQNANIIRRIRNLEAIVTSEELPDTRHNMLAEPDAAAPGMIDSAGLSEEPSVEPGSNESIVTEEAARRARHTRS